MIIVRGNVLKHLDLFLNVRRNFVEHINAQIKKANEVIIVKKTPSFLTTRISNTVK